jgi:hypothetical protein
VRQLALAILVGLLSLSVSGVTALTIGEPCSASESSRAGDTSCPPTCVTCGCCAQSVEPIAVPFVSSPLARVAASLHFPPFDLLGPNPHDVLHVPKPRLA